LELNYGGLAIPRILQLMLRYFLNSEFHDLRSNKNTGKESRNKLQPEKIIETSIGEIKLRPFGKQHISAQLSYLYDSPPEFLESIGYDISKLPGKSEHSKFLHSRLETDAGKSTFHNIVAEYKGDVIASIFLHLGDVPRAHFHIFSQDLRGKGIGLLIFKRGLQMLMKQHSLTEVFVEPKADNLPMNRLMEKCGFEFVGDSIFEGPITLAFAAKKYLIQLSKLD